MKYKNSFSYKVYFEDTDAGGVVYYANYLRFLERARTDFLDQCGISAKEYYIKKIFFAVKKVEAEYIKPLFYGDLIKCEVSVSNVKNASFTLDYLILKNSEITFKGSTVIVTVTDNFKLIKIPDELKIFLRNYKTLCK